MNFRETVKIFFFLSVRHFHSLIKQLAFESSKPKTLLAGGRGWGSGNWWAPYYMAHDL